MGALDEMADADTVERLFQTILGRPIGNEAFKRDNDGVASIQDWIDRLVRSPEFKARFANAHGLRRQSDDFIPDESFRTPMLEPHSAPELVLITGSCLVAGFGPVIEQAFPGTRVLQQIFNNGSELEDLPEDLLRRAAFQIVQIPLRSVLPEAAYFATSLSAEGRLEIERAFSDAVGRLRRSVGAALKYNRSMGLVTFLLNFAVPQANPLGMLMPKHDLTNMAWFVRRLNEALAEIAAAERSVNVIDYDEIASTIGKRYMMDDTISHTNHGSMIVPTDKPEMETGLTPFGSITEMFEPRLTQGILAVFNECLAADRVLSSTRKVKLVVFDLDGTLWRGVPADGDHVGGDLVEGWPLAIVEAAAFLKKRGILLAIVSKNQPETVQRLWRELYEHRFPLENFVSVKSSWRPKPEAVAEVLRETNLLAENWTVLST